MNKIVLIIFLIAAAWCIASCTEPETARKDERALIEITPLPNPTPPTEDISETIPEPPSPKEAFISGMMEKMTDTEKVGQMFIFSFRTDEEGQPVTCISQKIADDINRYSPGGIIYFAENIDTIEQTAALTNEFQNVSEIPLFIATDEEGGLVSRITKSGKIGAAAIPPAKTIGNTNNSENAYVVYDVISKELAALGINMNFAPCADLDSEGEGVIGNRAFSGDPYTAGQFVQKSIRAFNDNRIICAIKHFPGHGIATGDTHEDKILSEKSIDEISNTHMIPFQTGIEANVPVIMLSHITVSEWGEPASLCAKAVEYIRNVIGFNGLIITDALEMQAIANYYASDEAAAKAVNAGVNLLLMPADKGDAVNGVLSAIDRGEISMNAIDDSVKKILSVKYDYGLFDNSIINSEESVKIFKKSGFQDKIDNIFE